MEQNLSLYRIFNCVAEQGSISLAAKRLYISQPAVSKAIQQLEQNLDVILFIRNSRGVRLTHEGMLLYEHTKNALDLLRRGEESMKKINNLGIGHLHIGASTTLCKYLLLPYLNGFIKENPHIKITIENKSSSYTLKQLEENTLDIGLVAKPAEEKGFHFISLGEIEDIFVATNDYLDNLKVREHSNDFFSTATIMLLDEQNVSRMHIDDYFYQNGILPQNILEVSNMDLLIEFAKTSIGVACVIKNFVVEELENGTLLDLPLKMPINKREVGFCYAKNAFLSESTHRFIQFIGKSQY